MKHLQRLFDLLEFCLLHDRIGRLRVFGSHSQEGHEPFVQLIVRRAFHRAVADELAEILLNLLGENRVVASPSLSWFTLRQRGSRSLISIKLGR